ncbi:MAG: alpha/beta hydrolase [Myxococcaceae bacterium]
MHPHHRRLPQPHGVGDGEAERDVAGRGELLSGAGEQKHVDALRGAGKLAVAATLGVTGIVEELHRTIASGPLILGSPLKGPAKALTGLVYGTIRGVTGLVGSGLDAALASLAPLLGQGVPGPQREALQSVLNGLLGDYLVATGNPLAIPMELRTHGKKGAKLLVLLHGSSMSDGGWKRRGHDHGEALHIDRGWTPVYLRYNSGLHVSQNGHELAQKLEALVAGWPVKVSQIALLGFSMGGLVARSACHYAERASLSWRGRLRKLVTLGTPHHGSPLERGGNLLDTLLGVSAYSAPFARLAKVRSAGLTDLRYGFVLESHWKGRDRFALGGDPRRKLNLPHDVDCYAIAATTAKKDRKNMPGDGLVPVASALGIHREIRLSLRFPPERRFVVHGARHLDLLDRAAVYARLREWL